MPEDLVPMGPTVFDVMIALQVAQLAVLAGLLVAYLYFQLRKAKV